MATEESCKLYDACVGFLVSERTDSDAWADVCRHVQQAVNNGDTSALVSEFKATEQQIKKDYAITALPTAWRTAKSTALKAVRCGIELVDVGGVVQPKTAVEKAITALTETAVPKNADSSDFVQLVAKAALMAQVFTKECETAGPIDRDAHDRMTDSVDRLVQHVAAVPYVM